MNKTFHLKGENNLATFFYLKKNTYEFLTLSINFKHWID